MSVEHIPVMVDEVMSYLLVGEVRRVVDGTLGLGGHARTVLERCEKAEVLGIDRDRETLARAEQNLSAYHGRVHTCDRAFSAMRQCCEQIGWDQVDGILLDLGVSSVQIDEAQRGFSLRCDGPLDMRMDRRGRTTAAMLLNRLSEDALTDILQRYGEERRARKVAQAVVRRRRDRPWERTVEFAELVESVVGRPRRGTLPSATRCFQALRIAVNRELEELEQALTAAVELLRPGGRLVVISFHSLEDRIVKHTFRHEAATCVCPPGCPTCICGKVARLRVLTRRPVRPGPEEVDANRRASSAKLRAAERI